MANKYINDEQRKRELMLQNKDIPVRPTEGCEGHDEIMKWRITMETILVQTCRRLEEFIQK